jgi:DNA-binding NarL/FixJ family response regulator
LKSAAEPFRLTRRELQTLALLAIGQPWKQIAETMGEISLSTVAFHVRNICKKIGATSTVSALAKILLKAEKP